MSRPYTETAYNALKSALRAVLDDIGGIEAAQTFTRVNRSVLGDYVNRDSAKFAPIDVVIDLEHTGGTPRVTAALARAAGYTLVKTEGRSHSVLAHELARIGTDVGHLFSKASHALNGSKITPNERDSMLRDLDDLARACAEAISLLAQS
jgi:hypothetical protein